MCNKSSRAGIAADGALFQVTGEWRAQPAAAHDTLRTSKCQLGVRSTPFASFRMGMGASPWGLTTRDRAQWGLSSWCGASPRVGKRSDAFR